MANLLIPVVIVWCAFGSIFIFCELGERLTGRFAEIDNEMCSSDWYTFPMDIQKMLPIILNGTQASVVLIGIGNISCTREAFKNVNQQSIANAHIQSDQNHEKCVQF